MQITDSLKIVLILLGIVSFLLIIVSITKAYLSKFIFTTRLYTMERTKSYHFKYKHGIFLRNTVTVSLYNEPEDKTYFIKETIYYSFKKHIQISVVQEGIIVYTIDLRNVIAEKTTSEGDN